MGRRERRHGEPEQRRLQQDLYGVDRDGNEDASDDNEWNCCRLVKISVWSVCRFYRVRYLISEVCSE